MFLYRCSLSDLTDVNFILVDLDKSLFPGIDPAAQAHNGFLAEHAKTASTILGGVNQLLSSTGAKTVITVRSWSWCLNEPQLNLFSPTRSVTRWEEHWPSLIRSSLH